MAVVIKPKAQLTAEDLVQQPKTTIKKDNMSVIPHESLVHNVTQTAEREVSGNFEASDGFFRTSRARRGDVQEFVRPNPTALSSRRRAGTVGSHSRWKDGQEGSAILPSDR